MKESAIPESPIRDNLKVVMIRSNPIVSDPRVFKEIRSLLASQHYEILVLAWDRGVRHEATGRLGRAIIKRMRFKAPYSNLFLIGYLPVFWVWTLFQLFVNHPLIVHSFDVDTMIPAYVYRKLTRDSKVIFDLCDRFSDSLLLSRPMVRPLKIFLGFLEDMCACKADALIVVSQRQLMSLKRAKSREACIIMNCPEKTLFRNIVRKKSDSFRIIHAASLRGDYGILELIKALEDVEGIEVIFAGRSVDQRIVDQISKSSKIRFIGELQYHEALKLASSADVIPVLCDPKRPTCREALPNRLFEAMMLGVPVIVNEDFEMAADIVSRTGCGVVTKYDIGSIREAILFLKENASCRRIMGRNGQHAFKSAYNWNEMEKLLLKTYDQLTSAHACS